MLCAAERVTTWHFEDDDCWVADCLVCGTPMAVWRPHGIPDDDLERRLLARLEEIASARYPQGYWIDPERRRIPDHWHAHARPSGGFFDPGHRPSDDGRSWPGILGSAMTLCYPLLPMNAPTPARR